MNLSAWKKVADPDFELTRYDYSTLLNPNDHIIPLKSTFGVLQKYENNNNVQEQEIECPICFEDFSRNIRVTMKCKHDICSVCISKIAQDDGIQCPLCRGIHKLHELTPHFPGKSFGSNIPHHFICVVDLTPQEHYLFIQPYWKIARIKELLEFKIDVPSMQQRLIFGGRQMGDEKTAVEYSLVPGSKVFLFLALRGD
mmetsp:Transcript_1484/g.1965  ORF Transcript_1484/g.1965 Transcript_1484/m.1965 type:complete len:198 (-) Transcript_1484:75-668(-)